MSIIYQETDLPSSPLRMMHIWWYLSKETLCSSWDGSYGVSTWWNKALISFANQWKSSWQHYLKITHKVTQWLDKLTTEFLQSFFSLVMPASLVQVFSMTKASNNSKLANFKNFKEKGSGETALLTDLLKNLYTWKSLLVFNQCQVKVEPILKLLLHNCFLVLDNWRHN